MTLLRLEPTAVGTSSHGAKFVLKREKTFQWFIARMSPLFYWCLSSFVVVVVPADVVAVIVVVVVVDVVTVNVVVFVVVDVAVIVVVAVIAVVVFVVNVVIVIAQ